MTQPLLQGFSREGVEALSQLKGEPAWMLEKRLAAWEVYEQTPAPLGRRGDLGVLARVARFKYETLTPLPEQLVAGGRTDERQLRHEHVAAWLSGQHFRRVHRCRCVPLGLAFSAVIVRRRVIGSAMSTILQNQ